MDELFCRYSLRQGLGFCSHATSRQYAILNLRFQWTFIIESESNISFFPFLPIRKLVLRGHTKKQSKLQRPGRGVCVPCWNCFPYIVVCGDLLQ